MGGLFRVFKRRKRAYSNALAAFMAVLDDTTTDLRDCVPALVTPPIQPTEPAL